MSEIGYGGLAICDLFRVMKVSGAYQVQKADGSAAATANSDRIYRLVEIEQTQMQPQDDGTFKALLDQYDMSEDIYTKLFNVYAKGGSASGTAPAPFIKENGVSRGGTSANGPWLLAIHYGILNEAGTKYFVHSSMGTLKKSSGGVVYKAGQWIKPAYAFDSAQCETTLTIAAALFDGTYIDVASIGAQTIAQYEHYERKYLAKAA